MESDIRVASPPAKPLMVYDGDCNFCKLWIARWRQITGETVDYLPSQDEGIAIRFPEIPSKNFTNSVQLIEPDGAVASGAYAVFRSLAQNSRWQWPLQTYNRSSFVASASETAYRFVANHRTLFSRLTRLFWGRHVERPEYYLTRWIFLHGLGAIYLVAFISFWLQAGGLIGHNGILPAGQFMTGAKQFFDQNGVGFDRYHQLPTLYWFNSSDQFANFQCAVGTVLAVLLIVGIAPIPCLALLWLFYLSLCTVGQVFYGFQWDNLLLEAGFLAIFFAPWQMLPRPWRETPPSRLALWLLRFLLFKLMFSSGCVKLLSGDPAWHNLTAITFHYETQPLPTWIGWQAAQLPVSFQKFSCAAMFFIELVVPFLIFAPRRLRFISCAALVGLQLLILLTGNYTFFNFLALALCVLLLDDFLLQKIFPARLADSFKMPKPHIRWRWPVYITLPLTGIMLYLSLYEVFFIFGTDNIALEPAAKADQWLEPFRTISNYGLFAVMTTSRREIIVQGSDNGTNWLTYEFKYKPGNLNQRPRFIEPFQPRLDWQMWFAALGDYQNNPWFESFCLQLLRGSPEVLALLEKNPFPAKPPHYIRAGFYEYHFTNAAERHATGAWWKRELVGEYLPPVSLHE